ncbi:TetR/AcrR family transcriptional regulator [Nocardia colli]|uniref:TetR/AcrR family transcriptional regulator n=1 Tax=Nocardia colli TaxID=2545717 RepID=UPI0035DB6EFC
MNAERSPKSTPALKRSAGRRMTPERQQRILDVAAEIAIEDGFAAISMQSVAKRAGYTRPVVYDCYPSPEAIILAVLDREFETVAEEIEGIAASLTEPAARSAEGLVRTIIGRLELMRAQPRTWLLLSVPTEGTPDTVQARMNAIRETLRRNSEQALAQAVHDMPGPELDTEAASYLVQDVTHAFAQRMIAEPQTYTTQRVRGVIETLMIGMSSAPTNTPGA